MDPNLPPGIAGVQRNGDFQTIRFIDGSYVWCDSEQSSDGEWIDGRGIDAVLALAEAAATPLAPYVAEAELALNLSMIERRWRDARWRLALIRDYCLRNDTEDMGSHVDGRHILAILDATVEKES